MCIDCKNKKNNQPKKSITKSFTEQTYGVGEWLVNKRCITKEHLEDMESTVLIGIPSVLILNCIQFSSEFSDDLVHLANGETLEPENEESDYTLLSNIIKGVELYKNINFNTKSYNTFKCNIVKNMDQSVEFGKDQQKLLSHIYKMALNLIKLQKYTNNFSEIINVLWSTIA